MTISSSRKAYEDCFDVLDRALAAATGIRVGHDRRSQAMTMITRLNRARQLVRDQAREMYKPDDPHYSTSNYDTLIIRQPREVDEQWWVYIEHRGAFDQIEELGAAE